MKLEPVSLEKREVNNTREIVDALGRWQLVERDKIEMAQFGGYKRLRGKDPSESFAGTPGKTNLKILFLNIKEMNHYPLNLVGDDITT